jgi:hypothetical protein
VSNIKECCLDNDGAFISEEFISILGPCYLIIAHLGLWDLEYTSHLNGWSLKHNTIYKWRVQPIINSCKWGHVLIIGPQK